MRFKILMICMTMFMITSIMAAGPPDWSVDPAKYEHSGSIIAQVDGLAFHAAPGDMLAAFHNYECRGVSDQLTFPVTGANLHYLMVYSNQAAETLYFEFYSANYDTIYALGTIEYTADMITGRPATPLVLKLPNDIVSAKQKAHESGRMKDIRFLNKIRK